MEKIGESIVRNSARVDQHTTTMLHCKDTMESVDEPGMASHPQKMRSSIFFLSPSLSHALIRSSSSMFIVMSAIRESVYKRLTIKVV